MASSPITSWQLDGETVETVADFIFLGSKITADGDCSHEIKRLSYDQPRQNIKKQRHYFANKGPSSQGYGFPSDHVWMWELDYKESWVLKNWGFWTVVLEKTLESPWDCKEIQPVHPKGDQSWVFIGRTDAEAETPILWPSDVKNWLIGKDPHVWKDWRWKEKGTTEDELVGCHYWLKGHEFGWTPGAGDGQGGLACCSPRVAKSWTRLSDWTALNWRVITLSKSQNHQKQAVEKEMTTHSSVLAWKISWAEEPGRLQSKNHRVRHNWVTKLRKHQGLNSTHF